MTVIDLLVASLWVDLHDGSFLRIDVHMGKLDSVSI
jgi:hypothetical protein